MLMKMKMRKPAAWFVAVCLIAAPALASPNDVKEEGRVRDSGQVMKDILNIPDDIPQDLLDKAECVVILPKVLKGALGVGGSFGRGVMICRSGAHYNGPWGVSGAVRAGRNEHWISDWRASYGFCIAGDESEGSAVAAVEQSEAGGGRFGGCGSQGTDCGERYGHCDECGDSFLLAEQGIVRGDIARGFDAALRWQRE